MEKLNRLKAELTDELRGNILPFWAHRMRDDERGGFHGRMTGGGQIALDAPRGAVMYARIVWTFSVAYRLFGDPLYLDTATRAKDYLLAHFYDARYGGVWWALDTEGRPRDTKKQFYALAFAIYGLAEYHRATSDAEALRYAVKLFESIEGHSYDPVKGGYIEAKARDWSECAQVRLSDKDANERKTANTHLHILEAYTVLHRVWPSPLLGQRLGELVELFLGRIIRPSGHLGLFFDDDWQLRGEGISYGHDIEASWLLVEAAIETGPGELLEKTLKRTSQMALASLEGMKPDGGMSYHLHPDGRLDGERHWWVQAEAVVGQFRLWRHHGLEGGLEGAFGTWDYIRRHIVAPDGEWWWSTDPRGRPNRTDDRAGFWKCPYHNGRMCMELISDIEQT